MNITKDIVFLLTMHLLWLLLVVRVTEVDFSFGCWWNLLHMVWGSTLISAPESILKSTIEPFVSKFAVQILLFLSKLNELMVGGLIERCFMFWILGIDSAQEEFWLIIVWVSPMSQYIFLFAAFSFVSDNHRQSFLYGSTLCFACGMFVCRGLI